jgi:hypothetical protein
MKIPYYRFLIIAGLLVSTSGSSLIASQQEVREELTDQTQPRSALSRAWDGITFTARTAKFFVGEALKTPRYIIDEITAAARPALPAVYSLLGAQTYIGMQYPSEIWQNETTGNFTRKVFLRGSINFAAENLGFTGDFASDYLKINRGSGLAWLAETAAEKLHNIQIAGCWNETLFTLDTGVSFQPISLSQIAQVGTALYLAREIMPKERTYKAYARSAIQLAGAGVGAGFLGVGTLLGGGMVGAVAGFGVAKVASDVVFDGISWVNKAYKGYQGSFRK